MSEFKEFQIQTNFLDSNKVDLGKKLITRGYLYKVYPGIASQLGINFNVNLWSWGYGNSGRLGNFSNNNISTPVTTFAGGPDWKQVSAGSENTAAIKTDGTLWIWGSSFFGSLGVKTLVSRSTPITIFSGGSNWKQVSTNANRVAAIKTDGTLWTWGLPSKGALGRIVYGSTPVTTFAGGTNWADTATGAAEELYTISSGFSHSAAIKTDGTLWIWGDNTFAQLGDNTIIIRSTPITTFAGGTNWKQVSLNHLHSAAIKTDGTLWTWGSGGQGNLGNNQLLNRSTPVTTFAGGTNWNQVSVGRDFTAAIKTDGTLWTWGFASFGQLGNFDTNSKLTPVTTFSGGTDWKQVSAGYSHTSAIKTDGTLWVWGSNSNLQLGTNDAITRSTPVTTFAGGTDWKQVSSGTRNTAAIKTDGTLWVWGTSGYGTLGVPNLINRSTPITTFAGGTNWKQVSLLNRNISAVKTDGTLWVWGNGYYGNNGNGSVGATLLTPITTFAGGTNWDQVSVGNVHATALSNGELFSFGSNNNGQLGNNDILIPNYNPGPIFGNTTGWKQVSVFLDHMAAIKTDGTLWSWGYNNVGQLGTYFNGSILTPITTFVGGTDWKYVAQASPSNNTAAIKTDGTLWTWGVGSVGQLGNNTKSANQSTPTTTFVGGTDWKKVNIGALHMAAIKVDGTIWSWGRGIEGQLGRDVYYDSLIPITTFAGGTNWADTATGAAEELYTISSGYNYTAAIKTDGTLWTWGNGIDGILGNNDTTDRSTPVTTFAGGTDWKQVSSGKTHTSAIKTDGTLWTWGAGGNGQLGINDTTSSLTPVTTFAGGTDWKQVSVGFQQFTVAIKTDGTLWVWGANADGELGLNNSIYTITPVTTFAGGTDWKQVSAGYSHTSAIKTDGTLWVWGNGGSGRLGTNDTTQRNTPVTTFAGGTDWKQVSSGGAHTAAVKIDGTLWTWGTGLNGRLGTNDATDRSTPVTTFAGGTDWKQVSSASSHTAAIKTDGTLWTWGYLGYGQLGNNQRWENVVTSILTPVTTFSGGTDWKQVSANGYHTTAIKGTGANIELYTFGDNTSGNLGRPIGDITPDSIKNFTWKDVNCGFFYSAAIKTDGTLWVWGNNDRSQLGINATGKRFTPVTTFAGGTDWKQVSCGSRHTLAVKIQDIIL